MPSYFKPNRNLERELAAEGDYQKGLAKGAQPAVDAAKQFAPVEEGDYRDGIEVVIDDDAVRIDAKDWKSHFIEWGTVDTPIFAPLRRGVRAAGLRFKESDR